MTSAKRITTFALMIALMSVVPLTAGTVANLDQSVVKKDSVTLTVSIDKRAVQVADPVQLTLEVRAPQGTRVELPRLPEKLGDFEVQVGETIRDIPTRENPNDRLWVMKATLESIKTGIMQIPPIDVQFSTDKKTTTFETVRSEPLEIQIASVLEDRADPNKFRDIKDVVDVAVPENGSNMWLVWTGVGIGAVVAIALATAVLTRRRRAPTPAAWALAQIDDLEQLLSDDSADAQLTLSELINVVREFFEYEYNVPTLTRNSREFLNEAANTVRLGDIPHQRLASLVAVADDIKFARYGVSHQQVQRAFEDAKAFVLECEQHREALETEDA